MSEEHYDSMPTNLSKSKYTNNYISFIFGISISNKKEIIILIQTYFR